MWIGHGRSQSVLGCSQEVLGRRRCLGCTPGIYIDKLQWIIIQEDHKTSIVRFFKQDCFHSLVLHVFSPRIAECPLVGYSSYVSWGRLLEWISHILTFTKWSDWCTWRCSNPNLDSKISSIFVYCGVLTSGSSNRTFGRRSKRQR